LAGESNCSHGPERERLKNVMEESVCHISMTCQQIQAN